MTVTVLQSEGNRTDPARVRLDLEGQAFAQGTEFGLDISLLNKRRLLIQAFSIKATVPFAFPVWDYLEYLYFVFDRVYQNWAFGKVWQQTLDIRADVYPRVNAEFSRIDDASLTAEYVPLSSVNMDDVLVLIEKAAMAPRWEFEETPAIVAIRITVDGDIRVTTEGDQRVALVDELDASTEDTF